MGPKVDDIVIEAQWFLVPVGCRWFAMKILVWSSANKVKLFIFMKNSQEMNSNKLSLSWTLIGSLIHHSLLIEYKDE
jgi:hypothetical protein